jgi:two-component system NtrC family sensor kinase
MNAIQAMPNGGVITVSADRKWVTPPPDFGGIEAEYFCMSVADEGIGIRQEDLSQVFVPFFSTKGVGEGTGLGLSISHGIVSEHGGWMAVDSEIGKGTTFYIYLPLET